MEKVPRTPFGSGNLGGSCYADRSGLDEKNCFHCGKALSRVEFDSIEHPNELNRHIPKVRDGFPPHGIVTVL